MTLKYEYEKLPSPRHIRLLRLHKGNDWNEISCELIITALDDAPDFEALSYVWGDPAPRMRVHCSGRAAEIGPSLHGALHHLRQNSDSRILWADALCINQGDIQERNEQVRLMGELYKRAMKTLIWLGEDPDDQAWRAFQIIGVFDEILRDKGGVESQIATPNDQALARDVFHKVIKGHTLIKAIIDLFERPWFSRKWIIQELLNSNCPVVISGTHELPWQILESFAVRLRQDLIHIFMGLAKPGTTSIHHISSATVLAMMRKARNEFTLTDNIHRTLSFACSRPHDHIIGILGLVRSSEIHRFESLLDYEIPETELWHRYVKIAIESGDLGPLLFVDTLPLEVRPISWVPNIARLSEMVMKEPLMIFSSKSTYSEVIVKGECPGKVYTRHDRHMNASRNSELSARFLEDDTVLAVEGLFVDRVEELTSIAKPNNEEDVHSGAFETMELKYDMEKQAWDESFSVAFKHTKDRGRAEKVRVWEEFTRAWVLDFDSSLDARKLQEYHMYKERMHKSSGVSTPSAIYYKANPGANRYHHSGYDKRQTTTITLISSRC